MRLAGSAAGHTKASDVPAKSSNGDASTMLTKNNDERRRLGRTTALLLVVVVFVVVCLIVVVLLVLTAPTTTAGSHRGPPVGPAALFRAYFAWSGIAGRRRAMVWLGWGARAATFSRAVRSMW